jgi:hypothetical protein
MTGAAVFSSPAVADGKVFVGSCDSNVYCLDAVDGREIWSFTADAYIMSSPAVADGKVFVGSGDSNVYCLDADTGDKIWNYATGRAIDSSPALSDGKLCVGSNGGNVYCFGLPDDTIAPEIAITCPDSGDTVGGILDITVDASDNYKLDRVEFYVDDQLKNTADSNSYTFSWDTTTVLSDTTHTIKAVAYDLLGNYDDDQVTITVCHTLPTVKISSPGENENVVKETVTITGTSSGHERSVQKVEIKIDEGSWETASGIESWSYEWDTTKAEEGYHTIFVRSYDGIFYSTETSVTLIVNNVDQPELDINPKIFSIGKIDVFVKNIGKGDISDLSWSISAKSVASGSIDISKSGNINQFVPNGPKTVISTGSGSIKCALGIINIDVLIIADGETFKEKETGLVIGSLIIIL